MLSDDEDGDDALFEHRHAQHQISAFIELARDLAGQRRREREERRNQEEEEGGSNEDELEEENEDENDEEEANSAKTKKICNTSNSEETQECPKEAESTTEKSDGDEDVEMAAGSSSQNSGATHASDAASSSVVPHSDPIPVLAPAPATPSKASKKREKFDSGVGDDIENGKGPSSEESDLGDERDMDMDIDDSSDSAYSDNSAPRLMNYLLDPDDPSCPCGGNCSEFFKGRRTGKQEEEEEGEEAEGNDKGDEEGKEEGAACKKASATEIYSTYMREKIKLLPLPLALKLYLNYNREL